MNKEIITAQAIELLTENQLEKIYEYDNSSFEFIWITMNSTQQQAMNLSHEELTELGVSPEFF